MVASYRIRAVRQRRHPVRRERLAPRTLRAMSESAGYSGTPLAAKLGIRAATRALLVGTPAGWVLPDPPPTATIHAKPGPAPYDVIMLFCLDHAVLATRFVPLSARLTTAGALWVAWPKKASGVETDLTENAVREFGLDHGLVDVKIAAVDATWSGLKFVRRLKDRSPPASQAVTKSISSSTRPNRAGSRSA
jgi:hypothetical protein